VFRGVFAAFNLFAALIFVGGVLPSPVKAGGEFLDGDATTNRFLGLMLREICVDTFPRFSKAASVIDSKPYFARRAGQKIWDHFNYAVTLSITRLNGKPACVMHAISNRWTPETWASYAVPVFGVTWDSDQTIIDKGTGHKGDNWRQHILVRFPTYQQFAFDADRRSDGKWLYTITLIAAK
jgi:hypothetical protein